MCRIFPFKTEPREGRGGAANLPVTEIFTFYGRPGDQLSNHFPNISSGFPTSPKTGHFGGASQAQMGQPALQTDTALALLSSPLNSTTNISQAEQGIDQLPSNRPGAFERWWWCIINTDQDNFRRASRDCNEKRNWLLTLYFHSFSHLDNTDSSENRNTGF